MARILVNQSAQTENGDRLASAVIGLITQIETLKRLKIVAAVNIDASGGTPDYTEVEAEFGLAPGEGAPFYNMLSDAVTALDNADLGTFLATVGRR